MLTEAEARKLGFEIARRTDEGTTEPRAKEDWYIRSPQRLEVDPHRTKSRTRFQSERKTLEELEDELRWREWFLGL
jgi:hypothetical protein